MKKISLVSQIFASYIIVAVVAIAAVASYSTTIISSSYRENARNVLTASAQILTDYFKANATQTTKDSDVSFDTSRIDTFCKVSGKQRGYRITLILPNGKVIGDSDEDPEKMENHADRPEIKAAIEKGLGESIRYSSTLGKRMMYVAVPLTDDTGKTIGITRTSQSLSIIDDAIGRLWQKIYVASLCIIVIVAMTSSLVSRRITKPLQGMRMNAEAIGKGNLKDQIPPSGLLEVDVLAETINLMAAQLNKRITAATLQVDEQNALLSCMVENVLAVDTKRRLIKMNRSAQELFRADTTTLGRNVMEVIRNNELLDIINLALASSEPVEGDVFLQADCRHLHAHGTVLTGADGGRIGALIVLYDVTRLNKLEEVRRDFVANVSHELKTPITSIKGFVETLLDGAMKDPVETEKFLRIVGKQADRLSAIIDDLLTLSRVEEDVKARTIPLETIALEKILHDSVEICAYKAAEKKINIQIQCAENLTAAVNAALLEQALVNLVDNAIKYSEESSSIDMEASKSDGCIVIRVQDYGVGIEKSHLSRIFERFYRVDKGRSRQLGGTGLGLSIVKHIALVHNGNVAVDSTPGKGSTFSISIPA